MASIIRIKRSSTSLPPGTLGNGELAYSAGTGTQSNGGERLYIGFGTETNGGAPQYIIGGKYFTDKLDHPEGTLTANSAILVDSNSKIDVLNVDNLTLNGNTLSSTDTDGDINIDPDGTGQVNIYNPYIYQTSTSSLVSLTEYIQDVAGGGLVDSAEIDATYDDTTGTTSLALKTTGVSAGSYGSSTAIPTFTVDTKGRLTAAGSVSVATQLTVSDGTASDTVDLLTDTLTIAGSGAINTSVATNTVTVSVDTATTSALGVAKFDSTDFTVTGGDVTVNAITLGSSSLNPGQTTTDIAGLTSVTVDNITLDGSTVSTSTGALILNPSGDLRVTHTDFVANRIIYSSDASGTLATNSKFTYDGTTLTVDGDADIGVINIATNEISTTDTNGNLVLAPNGTGTVTVPSGYEGRAGFGASSLVNKSYVDSVANGLDVKASCRVATTGPLATTYSSGVLTATSNGAISIDGVSLSTNDRVLVKDQTDAKQNGFYLVTNVGSTTAAFVLTRTPDANDAEELTGGAFTFIEEGTTNADNGYVATHDGIPTIGSTNITFDQFSGAGQIDAGNGLTKTGNTINAVGTANRITINPDSIDIASTYVGQTSITTLGTIATGTWNGSTIGATYGGTGFSSYSAGDLLYASNSTTLTKLAAGTEGKVLQINASGVPVWGDVDGGTY